jgi:threonine dehydrogenase-like Zn-dependent dehydrogenase
MIGCAVARLVHQIPGVEVELIDVDRSKADICAKLGVAYAHPEEAELDRDLIIEASGSEQGLQFALEAAVTEGEIIVASWFGDRAVRLNLGEDFHSRRLTIRSSQVGMIAPRRRATHSTRSRMALALRLLRDPAFDALLTDSSSWRDLPEVMAAMAEGSSPGLCHTIDWRDSE